MPSDSKASRRPNSQHHVAHSRDDSLSSSAVWGEPLQFGDLTVPVPIVQGGMGVGVSLAGLASAVADAGGLGVLSAVGIGMLEGDLATNFLSANLRALRSEIRQSREQTRGVLGINVMVALTDYGRYVRVAVEEGIDVVFSGAGLPLTLPALVPEGARVKLVPIVSSARAAVLICRKWHSRYGRLPDGLVVEGPLAGGHLGFRMEQISDPDYALEKLVPEVVSAAAEFESAHGVKIPVIAAGGIYTGADIVKFRRLGASAVQMGTRFVTTDECDVDDAFKRAYLDCTEEDLVLIKSPVGLPGRAVRNEFTDAIMQGERKPVNCPFRCISTCDGDNSPYCIALALLNAKRGRLKSGFAFAGANAYRTDEIISVAELIRKLGQEYAASC